jgi:hypothetical protein
MLDAIMTFGLSLTPDQAAALWGVVMALAVGGLMYQMNRRGVL